MGGDAGSTSDTAALGSLLLLLRLLLLVGMGAGLVWLLGQWGALVGQRIPHGIREFTKRGIAKKKKRQEPVKK